MNKTKLYARITWSWMVRFYTARCISFCALRVQADRQRRLSLLDLGSVFLSGVGTHLVASYVELFTILTIDWAINFRSWQTKLSTGQCRGDSWAYQDRRDTLVKSFRQSCLTGIWIRACNGQTCRGKRGAVPNGISFHWHWLGKHWTRLTGFQQRLFGVITTILLLFPSTTQSKMHKWNNAWL